MPGDVLVKVSKVTEKGQVQLSPEVRERLGLRPGTVMIVYATEEGVVLRRADLSFAKESPPGLLKRLRGMFAKVPIQDIESSHD